ncbi:MAG: ABC transporter permease [Bacillota bacterium]
MAAYLVRRSLGAVPVLLALSVFVFLLMHLAPGDPVQLLLPESATDEDIAAARAAWGLDRPLAIQYLDYVSGVLRGDLGRSMVFGDPVVALILQRLPATVELAFLGIALAILVAIPLGVGSASRHDTIVDHLGTTAALLGISVPHFWLGIMLILVFGGMLRMLPVSGRIDFGVPVTPVTGFYLLDGLLTHDFPAFWSALRHAALPAITLGTSAVGLLTRITRSSVLEVVGEDYVLVARSKGLSGRVVVWKHAVRNALIPVITVLGLQVGALLSGSIIVETVFAWPGIGSFLVQAVGMRDYKLVQGIVFFYASAYVIIHLVVDILYAAVDPRLRT